MHMPFGPHKDQPLEELSTRYLRWIVSDVNPAEWPDLVDAAKEELKFRGDFQKETEVSL
jgi:uncharacterized protein (DUF3820 family)